ncbi:hypothetical protein [Novosphingobium sp.]|uniref:hypothetical protein n=1 Tax=Novosphingobium sp. TaxID=1874826 RepID=UPI001B1203EC|nr:hypothetical protein [Novosphingobium sp.]
MNGLLSSAPSAPAIRLIVAGYLLMLLQIVLLLLAASLDAHARMLVWTLCPLGVGCFAMALAGWPGSETPERKRHVR